MRTVSRSSRPVDGAAGVRLVRVSTLRHIEGFSERRVAWLMDKICRERVWTRPVCLAPVLDANGKRVHLVLDGQHRTEVALRLELRDVPALLFDYEQVEVFSLRPSHVVSVARVIERTLAGDPYPYKTVKHRFATPIPELSLPLAELEGASARERRGRARSGARSGPGTTKKGPPASTRRTTKNRRLERCG